MARILVAALALCSFCQVASAEIIYRGTDADGRVQMSNVAPPKRFLRDAERIDTSQFAIPESQRRAALDQAARDKAQLRRLEARQRRAAAVEIASATTPAALPDLALRP